MHATQQQIYEETAKPMLDGVLQGLNATIFAYGVCYVEVTADSHAILTIHFRLRDVGRLTPSAVVRKMAVSLFELCEICFR